MGGHKRAVAWDLKIFPGPISLLLYTHYYPSPLFVVVVIIIIVVIYCTHYIMDVYVLYENRECVNTIAVVRIDTSWKKKNFIRYIDWTRAFARAYAVRCLTDMMVTTAIYQFLKYIIYIYILCIMYKHTYYYNINIFYYLIVYYSLYIQRTRLQHTAR